MQCNCNAAEYYLPHKKAAVYGMTAAFEKMMILFNTVPVHLGSHCFLRRGYSVERRR